MKTFELIPFNRPNKNIEISIDDEDVIVFLHTGSSYESIRFDPNQFKEFLINIVNNLLEEKKVKKDV